MFAHVFAVGNLESSVNPNAGGGENPSGGLDVIPVANVNIFSSLSMKVASFTTISPLLDSI